MNSASSAMPELASIEIEQPTCEQCGCVIEDLEELIYQCAADLVRQWEMTDPRDRWRHTGEAPPKISNAPPRRPEPYRPAESTVQAFLYVATHEPDKLKTWLARHPDDAPALHQIWKAKRCSK
jgi:hypothetical protein